MKAHHFMMGLFLFNISVIVFNMMSIWTIGYGGSDLTTIIGMVSLSVIVGLVSAFTAAAAISRFAPGAQNVALYASFSGLYLGLWAYTSLLLNSISESVGGLAMISIFTAIFIVALVIGMYQMVTGGWQSYE